MAAVLDIPPGAMAPNELIRTLLKAPVDLVWNGGMGTYVKASSKPISKWVIGRTMRFASMPVICGVVWWAKVAAWVSPNSVCPVLKPRRTRLYGCYR